MAASVNIEKLARLAKLQLSDDERASFSGQIGDILTFVEKLSELDTDGVEPMTSALDVDNRFRQDVAATSLTPDEATRTAPEASEGFFLVPPVLGKK